MILRLLVAVALTTALVAVAVPAITLGSADRTDGVIERQLTELERELSAMTDTDDPTAGPGARHVTELRLPERSLTTAGVRRLRFHSREGVALASWRVGDSATGKTRIAGVPVQADGGESLTLREAGTHRLAFELQTRANRPVLTVDRLGGETNA